MPSKGNLPRALGQTCQWVATWVYAELVVTGLTGDGLVCRSHFLPAWLVIQIVNRMHKLTFFRPSLWPDKSVDVSVSANASAQGR
jgi:hypothetical protein